MGMSFGKEDASSGMSLAIFTEIDRLLSPQLTEAIGKLSGDPKATAEKGLEDARNSWRQLSFAIAKGVIGHIHDNMEIKGVQTRGNVSASGSGVTGAAPPGPHTHTVSLNSAQSGVTFTQSNDGTGHVA